MKKLWSRQYLPHLAALLLAVGIVSLVVVFRGRIQEFRSYGYLGIFLISIISCATIVVPMPGMVLVFTLGGILNPLLVGLVSGTGGTIGELTGYMLGYGGRGVVEGKPLYKKMEGWMRRWGGMLLFVLALIPNLAFDIAGAAAGALGYPVWKFLLYGGAGRILKHIGFAYAGAWGLESILRYFS